MPHVVQQAGELQASDVIRGDEVRGLALKMPPGKAGEIAYTKRMLAARVGGGGVNYETNSKLANMIEAAKLGRVEDQADGVAELHLAVDGVVHAPRVHAHA